MSENQTNESQSSSAINHAYELSQKLLHKLKELIIGRDDTIELLLTGLFAGGHALLEDYPGSGKTTLTKSLGQLISSDSEIANFKRIQFTPDMLPGDVLGVTIFEPKNGSFRFMPGPVFAHIVLADEINRTGPKVQSAFLECMAEKQVTIDNSTYPLDDLFFVVGTQNPLDIAGTYPLPLVQRDRFLIKIPMSYVGAEEELKILEHHHHMQDKGKNLEPLCSRDEIIAAQQAIAAVHVHEDIQKAIVAIVQSTRHNPSLLHGASTRAALMLQQGLRAFAVIKGRDYVNSSDLAYLTPFILLHRLHFQAQAGSPKEALSKLVEPELEVLIKKTI